jgi:hypothetical protein
MKRTNSKIIITLIFSLVSLFSTAQNDRPERTAFGLKLPVDTVQFYEQVVRQSPYFPKENILQIYPSEKVFIEVEKDKSGIVSMKSVKENLHPEKTITVELKQSTKGKLHEMTVLSVTNPFKKKLHYKAMMYVVGVDKWLPTSVIPVEPKLLSFETWEDVVITLLLSDWSLK